MHDLIDLPRSPLAESLPPDELAAELARQTLAAVRADRHAAPLQEAVRLGHAAGLTVAEMQRMSGFSRPAIYSALEALDTSPRAARPDVLSRQVLSVLCQAGGAVPLVEIGRRLRLDVPTVHGAVISLTAQGFCSIDRSAGRDARALSAIATNFGVSALRTIFDDLYLRRAEGFSVYLRVADEHIADVERAAAEVLSREEHTMLRAEVAPSRMTTPELAFIVHAPTSRLALLIVRDVWAEICRAAGLTAGEPPIAGVIAPSTPPSVESAVLDTFVDAIAAAASNVAGAAADARARFAGGLDERRLAGRCLTAAAAALRFAVGNEGSPREIVTADDAFDELAPASGVPVGRGQTKLKREVIAGLNLAAERLGPFRGGELGSLRHPDQPPPVVTSITPTDEELTQMAAHAGAAVGIAAGQELLDVREVMRGVLAPL